MGADAVVTEQALPCLGRCQSHGPWRVGQKVADACCESTHASEGCDFLMPMTSPPSNEEPHLIGSSPPVPQVGLPPLQALQKSLHVIARQRTPLPGSQAERRRRECRN
jgi:hypothetical protein